MMLDAVRQRLETAIDSRGQDDHLIDRNEEREILQLALQLGVDGDTARALLGQVCDRHDYLRESAIVAQLTEEMRADIAKLGRMDERRFHRWADRAEQLFAGTHPPRACRRIVLEILEDRGWNRVRLGWLTDWYANAKREAGMV